MILGLLGGIASGKSTFAKCLADRGAIIVSGDQATHTVLERPEIRAALLARWGSHVFNDGKPNRKIIARLVFNNPEELKFLEQLTKNPVKLEIARQINSRPCSDFIVLDAPMMLELGIDKWCDDFVFVKCDYNKRLQRFYSRQGFETLEEAKQSLDVREARQISLDIKSRWGDLVIDNTDEIVVNYWANMVWDYFHSHDRTALRFDTIRSDLQ